MILNSLKVQNYKLLKDFEVEKLGRVNLIVGKNNSGKSTVLESLRIFASKGNPSVINNILESHDDRIMVQTRGEEEDSILIYEGLFTKNIIKTFVFFGKKIYSLRKQGGTHELYPRGFTPSTSVVSRGH
jgi:AAA15 family ATPase/GTPase